MAKIVVITSRFPFPLEKGDKLRVYNQIKYLGKENDVYLIALNSKTINAEQLEALKPHCKEIKVFVIPLLLSFFNLILGLFSTRPLQVSWFYSKSKKLLVNKYIHQIAPDVIYSHLIRTSDYVKEIKNVPKTLDYMDCFSKGFKLKIEKTKNPFLKLIYAFEYKRLLNYETSIFNRFDHHCIISKQDLLALNFEEKTSIHLVPNGVDFDIFYPSERERKFDLLFSGNMGYPPNIDAAFFAAKEVLPLIRKRYPNVRLLIAGVNAPQKIKRLSGPNISVIEEFTHIREAFLQSKVNLVPVVTSIGLQNKILQAMAMKIPTVTTSAGAKGIGVLEENVVLVGDSAEKLAEHIFHLLEDEKLYNEISRLGFEFVQRNFSWNLHNQKLLDLLVSNRTILL